VAHPDLATAINISSFSLLGSNGYEADEENFSEGRCSPGGSGQVAAASNSEGEDFRMESNSPDTAADSPTEVVDLIERATDMCSTASRSHPPTSERNSPRPSSTGKIGKLQQRPVASSPVPLQVEPTPRDPSSQDSDTEESAGEDSEDLIDSGQNSPGTSTYKTLHTKPGKTPSSSPSGTRNTPPTPTKTTGKKDRPKGKPQATIKPGQPLRPGSTSAPLTTGLKRKREDLEGKKQHMHFIDLTVDLQDVQVSRFYLRPISNFFPQEEPEPDAISPSPIKKVCGYEIQSKTFLWSHG
jgi:hypothetical protein